MLTSPTIQGLRELKLDVMASSLEEQRSNSHYDGLSFEDRLGLLVDQEVTERKNRRLRRLLQVAKLRSNAIIEDIDFKSSRGLDRSNVLTLAQSHWVTEHHSILVTGPTGVGKTYLACALANSAIRHGHSALYVRAPRLFEDIAIARADGRLVKYMASLARTEVLVIDDLFLRPLDLQQAADLLEVVEDRHQLRSTIAGAQLPLAHWHEAIGDATIADAVLDRLLHNAHRITLSGESLRQSDVAVKKRRSRGVEDASS
ncbi:transposition helper protein [mine drainage metagenome]|uniref:Transposition helper protein n=1 Tax=mine drainage metagenome TaxID=410659 RepID=T1CS31_9ZZZZ